MTDTKAAQASEDEQRQAIRALEGKPFEPSMPGRDYDDRCDMENPEA